MDSDLGFTLVGEDMPGTQTDLQGAAPGTVVAIDQDLYREADAAFEAGERVGWLTGTAVLTHRDQLVCHLVFVLDGSGSETIVAEGVLPSEDTGFGAGVLALTGGTGRFAEVAGTVTVETRNPKRYSF